MAGIVIPKIHNGRNKTFFFGDFEKTRIRKTATVAITIPTLKMCTGDFSELTKRVNDPTTGQQFPGNIIPASRIDVVANRLVKLYPNPQTPSLAKNFIFISPRNQNVDKWDLRAHHNVGTADNFFFRFNTHDTFLPDTPLSPRPRLRFRQPRLHHRRRQYRHRLEPHLHAQPHHDRPLRLELRRFQRNNPASALSHNFNQEYGIPGASYAPDGGWSVGSIVTASASVPFSPTVSGNPANTGTYTVVQRPDVVGSPSTGTRTLQQDFNTAAFARPANFTYGNAGRNILRGRPIFNWDFSALKNFRITERVKAQFRFEAFTFTNTPRFGQPGNVLGTAAFGVVSSANTPRNLQFGLKLLW